MARILIVEDEPLVRKTLIHILMLQGHLVAGSGSGKQAILLNEELMPDLVLVDLKLPGMSGLEVIDYLRKTQNPPRIVAMAGSGAEALALAQNLGADAALQKPFDIRKLLEVMALQAA